MRCEASRQADLRHCFHHLRIENHRKKYPRADLGICPRISGRRANGLTSGGCGRGSGRLRNLALFGWHREVQCHSEVGKLHRADKASIRSGDHNEPARCGLQTEWKRSEEHTSELQSHLNLVCRLLLEKKKKRWKTTEKPP